VSVASKSNVSTRISAAPPIHFRFLGPEAVSRETSGSFSVIIRPSLSVPVPFIACSLEAQTASKSPVKNEQRRRAGESGGSPFSKIARQSSATALKRERVGNTVPRPAKHQRWEGVSQPMSPFCDDEFRLYSPSPDML
jgi:hypothetical protein